ncbi:TonB-dependent receptor [Rhodoferax lacus]|uniref:TonB-dependent receptor n=1 Tax=Rhodoferax lacus TaxID=2184758 RepID=A0A3E1R7Z3_9BURK|nr:TonB-dependent receptor [Rhodoferax lacus]RFO95162.1 TonB-dependent receptor [Rhodoferax lacus]
MLKNSAAGAGAPSSTSILSLLAVLALGLSDAASAHDTSTDSTAPVKSLGVVTVTGGQPTSLPTQIPTTIEGITREQIEQTTNATDSEDALKYLPSLLVRKRYIGDYNHAVLSSRASGTGNSARSAVYADGILLSNYLGNGATYAPRWGMVTPEEIERVDVMYGPFSAAYPGNSVGAVVDYVTRMPTQFEGHAKISLMSQPFKLYNTDTTYNGSQESASLGNRQGDWSWFADLNHTDSQGQPLTFPTRLLSQGVASSAGTAVTGAVRDANTGNAPIYILGTGTQYHTIQDHAKVKLAYDFNPTLRASYTLGLWQNTSEGRPVSYLKDANGKAVYAGVVNIGGLAFNTSALTGGDFPLTNDKLVHSMQGLSLKSHTQGVWDWEVAASLYNYDTNIQRQNGTGSPAANTSNPLPAALNGGNGTITDGNGTGWNTLALKGIWRPQGPQGAHLVDFGYQQDSYQLGSRTSLTNNWISGAPGTLVNEVGGHTALRSVYAQDSWGFRPNWKTVLGARIENWTADNGFTTFGVGNAANTQYATRNESFVSPKAALSYQWADDLLVKASVGRAVRMPTVSELYGATTVSATSQYINDPKLRPEKSWTAEFTAEKDLGNSLLRITYFVEDVKDALYSQSILGLLPNPNTAVTRVQNIGRILTNGLELAFNGENVLAKGLDLSGSITYTDSQIMENEGYVVVPGDTIGKRQSNIPTWRATALASYRVNDHWSTTLGARYSGPQFRTLNNADVNGYTYQGVSEFFTTDVRVRYAQGKRWSASFGIDNLNNYQYWNFHPYPNRSYVLEFKGTI